MEERMRESLSALMDDEANELELERILSRAGEDVELRQTWVRYNAVRSLASGQSVGAVSADISARVSEAIAEEVSPAALTRRSRGQRLLRPLASFAVAASVATVVVIGGQQLSQVGSGQAPVLAGAPVGHVGAAGAALRASYPTGVAPQLQPVTRTAYRRLAHEKMQRYMQEHAEHAALNTPQGLIPFARVPQIRE